MATARVTIAGGITADGNTCIVQPPRVYRGLSAITQPPTLNPLGGENATTGDFLEIASGTFYANDFVQIINTVATAQATVDFSDVGNVLTQMVGMSLEASTGAATGTRYPKIMVIDSRHDYLMNLYHGTAASTTKAMANGLIGYSANILQCRWTYTAGVASIKTVGIFDVPAVDLTQTDFPRVIIVGVPDNPDVSSTDQYVPVIVRFKPFVVNVATGHAYQALQLP